MLGIPAMPPDVLQAAIRDVRAVDPACFAGWISLHGLAGSCLTMIFTIGPYQSLWTGVSHETRQMWTPKHWRDFIPRLTKWMSIWEETGRRHGLEADSGFLLGGEVPGIADVVTATLWSTMIDRFRKIQTLLDEAAPMTAALSRRVSDLPPLVQLAAKAQHDYGDAYCGSEIGASLKKVLSA